MTPFCLQLNLNSFETPHADKVAFEHKVHLVCCCCENLKVLYWASFVVSNKNFTENQMPVTLKCDQIERFIGLWATFQGLPKSSTFLGNFCKGVKIYHFLVKSFSGNFYRHLAIFSGHTECKVKAEAILCQILMSNLSCKRWLCSNDSDCVTRSRFAQRGLPPSPSRRTKWSPRCGNRERAENASTRWKGLFKNCLFRSLQMSTTTTTIKNQVEW